MHPSTPSTQRFKVAVIGSGPAGIGVALGLARRGIGPVVIIERRDEAGGIPARYKAKTDGVPTFVEWTSGRVVYGEQFARHLLDKLAPTQTEIWLETQVIEIEPAARRLTLVNPTQGKFSMTADAVVMACGAREQTPAEKQWLAGARPARVIFTKHLIDWIDRVGRLPLRRPAILGSDLIAYSAAAKLKAAGSEQPIMIDARSKPESTIFDRLYFRRWTKPRWRGGVRTAEIRGAQTAECVQTDGKEETHCDGVVISGELVPNSELAIMAGLEARLPSRRLKLGPDRQLSAPGWFAAGNILGGFHGAQWCYFDGRRAAKFVTRYLEASSKAGMIK